MTEIRAQPSGSSDSSLTGATLGSYRILAPLADSGMGSAYRAEHASLGRPAAVKVLGPELTTDAQLVQRFLDEAKAAAKIRHPGIVEVYDAGTTEDGLSYLAMELLEGVSLEQRLAEAKQLGEVEAAVIARGIASVLEAVHREGIVHGDLKPVNVFLVPVAGAPAGARIKVLDFGIAKLIDPARAHRTQTGALIGTPLYMAPEQAREARAIDHRADLYSLGCVLYEQLVGRPPFVAAGAGEIIAQHLLAPPEPPSARAKVSAELDRIVMRLLQKEPKDRFKDAHELVEALDAITGVAEKAGRADPHASTLPAMPMPKPVTPLTEPGLADRHVPMLSGALRAPLADEREPREPEKRSSMGLIAGAITVAIAAAVAIVIGVRTGGGDEPAHGGSNAGSAEELAGSAAGSAGSAAGSAGSAARGSAAHGAAARGSAAASSGTRAQPAPAPAPAQPQPAASRANDVKDPRPSGKPEPKPRAAGSASSASSAGGASGPVTRPDGPVTRPDPGGPVTHPGVRTGNGSPSNPGESLNEKPSEKANEKAPEKPPEKPSEPKLPDKPAEPAPAPAPAAPAAASEAPP